MFELIISRMSVFYLNYSNSFIAIPLALFGLAIGSLTMHLRQGALARVNFGHELAWLVISSFFSFAIVFLLFSRFMAISHPFQIDWVSTLKTTAFVVCFLPPFYFIGRALTAIFYHSREQIGRLYAGDLFGAGLGAFATPVLFHFLDLPYLIFVCLLGMSIASTFFLGKRRWLFLGVSAAANLVVLGALILLEGSYDLSHTIGYNRNQIVTEIAHRWNEYSRVSLLRIKDKTSGDLTYRMIHDNAESNVFIDAFQPDNANLTRYDRRIGLPFLFHRPVNDVLVMFAGCGRQMVQYYAESDGRAHVTGVELNPLVRDLILQTPEMKKFRLDEFYKQPGVDLELKEGRYFLENDPKKYDVVYVGSDAATSVIKTGHSRKYLDTKEAMAEYLDHLRPGGLLIFHCIPSGHKLLALHEVYKERGWTNLDESVIDLTNWFDNCDFLVVSPSGFREDELETIKGLWPKDIYYLPGWPRNAVQVKWLLNGIESPTIKLVTDDSPFIQRIDFHGFKLFPPVKTLKNVNYYKSWIKVVTLFVIGAVLLLIVGGLYALRAKMPPPNMMLYLTFTGVSYMLCEIAFIAKLELFMGNPLYSMALLLTIFLMANALGSWLYNKLQARLNMSLMPLIVAGVVVGTMTAIEPVVTRLLGIPLVVKIPLIVALMFPVGVCLGLFYPFVVTWLTNNNRGDAVPITYAVSTLSSVAGASYAMTMIVNFGFTNLLYQAVAGYIALGLLMPIANRLSR
jgi:spermidine synthase